MDAKRLVVSERFPQPARRLQNLVQQLLRSSRLQATRVIQAGGARINGRTTRTPHTMLEIGDRLEVEELLEPAAPPAPQASSDELEIVFADEHLVVVNKPPGLLTVPTPYRESHTLIHRLERQLGAPPGQGAFCVHRLDRGVSGLLVFGKRLDVATALRDQFEQRKPRRQYVAIVAGRLRETQGTYRSYLTTDRNLHRHSTEDPQQGELAITHYRVVRTVGDATLVEVWLETGRRNQIRVHFAEAGHPVLGDPRYGGRAARHPAWAFRRMALHAESLAFRHPITGQELEFRAAWPPEMQAFVKREEGPSAKHAARPSRRKRARE